MANGNVEGTIGYGRRNFLVPMPRFDSFDDLNVRLEEQCLKRQDEVLRGHSETIGERLMRDLDALMALPPVAQSYDYPMLTMRPEANCKRYETLCARREMTA